MISRDGQALHDIDISASRTMQALFSHGATTFCLMMLHDNPLLVRLLLVGLHTSNEWSSTLAVH